MLLVAMLMLATGIPAMAQDSDDRPTCEWLMTEEGQNFLPESITVADVDELEEEECVWLSVNADEDPTIYPLYGQEYMALNEEGAPYTFMHNGERTLLTYRWGIDGALWPEKFPVPADRKFFSLAFTIEEGDYSLDGVECWVKLDADRNGEFDAPATEWPAKHLNSFEPLTWVGRGNGLEFSVDTPDGEQAWAMASCNAGASSGFTIYWEGELGTNEAAATDEADAEAMGEDEESDEAATEWPRDLTITITNNDGGASYGFYPDDKIFVITDAYITLTKEARAHIADGDFTFWVVGDGVDVEFECGEQEWNLEQGSGWCAETDAADIVFVVKLSE
jgi:hypothetical protein